VFVRGDVAVDVVPSLTKDVNVQFWLDYLYKQREAVLGVPKIFLGQSEGTNRATAEIVMQEYVTRLRMLQELIGDTLETDLFKQLLEAKFGEGVEVPIIKWRPIWEPTLDVKAKFISDLVDKNIILRSEARPQLGYPEQPTDEALAAENKLSSAKPKTTQEPVQQLPSADVKALPVIPTEQQVAGKKGRKWLIAEVS
jgi:hypothetical protein